MEINYTIEAFTSLTEIVNYIESRNTRGAGLRWLDRFEQFLSEKLKHDDLTPLCNNQTFQTLLLKCLNYNDWIIAFSTSNDIITIEAILHTSRISD